MANPTPEEVSGKAAPKADQPKPAPPKAGPAGETDEVAALAAAPKDEAKPEPKAAAKPDALKESARYRVLKAITLASGRTIAPGGELTLPDDDPGWPARRLGQMVHLKYLRPINEPAKAAAKADFAEDEDDAPQHR